MEHRTLWSEEARRPRDPRRAAPRLEALEDRTLPAGLVGDLVVFGDSLADAGNVALATGGHIPTHSELYYQGRFSGGPIWVDTLAEALGEPGVRPSLQPGGAGLDYAFGGATLAYVNTQAPFNQVPRVGQQVDQYLAGHRPRPDDLFAFWAGANDFFFSLGQTGAPIDPSLPAGALAGAVESLVARGGRQFVVANLPPLGETPYFLDLRDAGFLSQAAVDQFDQWSAGYNAHLAAGLAQVKQAHPNVTIVQADAAGLFQEALAPANPFGFANRVDAVGPYDANGHVTAITSTDPQGYLFFDSVHPGTKAHQLIGQRAAAQVLSALGVNTLTVTNTSDVVDPMDGGRSLREVLGLANAMPGRQQITFDLGRGAHEIRLSGRELRVTDDLTLQGTGVARLALDGGGASRIFTIEAGAHVQLADLTLRDGAADRGGAVLNRGDLTLRDVTLAGNAASTGGALANVGAGASALLVRVLVSGNEAHGPLALGGGVANLDGARLRVVNSVFAGNLARGEAGGGGRGGAIYNGAGSALTLERSLLAANVARGGSGGQGLGGGVYLARTGTARLLGSLVVGNFATTGGWNVFEE